MKFDDLELLLYTAMAYAQNSGIPNHRLTEVEKFFYNEVSQYRKIHTAPNPQLREEFYLYINKRNMTVFKKTQEYILALPKTSKNS
jgi:hypothetical protein